MEFKKFPLILPLLLLLVAGCGSLLPSTRQTVKSPWNNFEEAKAAYDRIIVGKCTANDLRRLGFDPFMNPNVTILTYVDIIQKFMFNPSIKIEDLDPGLQKCIKAKAGCNAYSIDPKVLLAKRHGNVLMDLFDFRRNTRETGWRFNALAVMLNGVVVYKQWGGNPSIDSTTITKNPLGPLQNPTIPIPVYRPF